MALTFYEDVSEQCLGFVKSWINLRLPGNNGQETLLEQLKIDAQCSVELVAEFPLITTFAAEQYIDIQSSHPEAIEDFIQDGYEAFEIFVDAMNRETLEEPANFYNVAEEVRQDVVNNFLGSLGR
jgi:hypothetical protein